MTSGLKVLFLRDHAERACLLPAVTVRMGICMQTAYISFSLLCYIEMQREGFPWLKRLIPAL